MNGPRQLKEILPSPAEQVEERQRQGPRLLTGDRNDEEPKRRPLEEEEERSE
jgi:hypothetical protein